MMKNNRIEGLRGILILWIVLYNYTFRYNGLFDKSLNFPIQFTNGGEVGVMMFFVISGYWAGRSLLNDGSIIKTFLRRYWRLWKSYFIAVLFISVWCALVHFPGRQSDIFTQVCNLFFISHPGIEYVDYAHWYVAAIVEIQLVFSLSLIIKDNNWRIRAVIGLLTILFLILYSYARFIAALPQELWWFVVALQGTLLGLCIRFINDGLVYKIIAAVLSVFLIHLNILYAFYILLFILCITDSEVRIVRIVGNLMSNRLLVYIGGISYCWYLIHQNVGFSLMYALIPNNECNMLWLLIPVTFTLILAIVLHEFYKRLHKPLLSEFPLFIISFFLLGGGKSLQRVHGHIVTPEPTFSLISLIGNVFVVLFFSYFLVCFVFWIKKKLFKTLTYFVLIVVSLVVSFIDANFGARICPAVITLVAETTSTESDEFMKIFAFTKSSMLVYLSCCIIIVITIAFEYLYKKLVQSKSFLFFFDKNSCLWSIMVGFVLMVSILSCTKYVNLFECETSDEVGTWEFYGPHDSVSDIIYTCYDLKLAGYEVYNAINTTKNAVQSIETQANTDSLNIILVIGESHIKWHSSLYGYNLPTNPLMEKEVNNGNLFVFENVSAPFIRTSDNIKNMLCTNSIGKGEKWYQSPFFPALFKTAGWHVSFFDNQRDWKKSASTVFALNSFIYNDDILEMSYHEINDTSFRYDAELVDYYSNLKIKRSNHNLIVFHLQGQHIGAGDRYPKTSQFERFRKEDIIREEDWIDDTKKRIIAEYDNATCYNDFVLKKITDLYRDENTIIIYLSDHGEETYDYRDQYGRNIFDTMNENYVRYIYEIPFLIWCSDKYLSNNMTTITSLRKSTKKAFSSDNLSQLLFSLGDVHTKYRKEDLNPLSDKYRCPKRVIEAKYCFDDYVKSK